jgi:DNA-binding beta-propeller fold protein YncE
VRIVFLCFPALLCGEPAIHLKATVNTAETADEMRTPALGYFHLTSDASTITPILGVPGLAGVGLPVQLPVDASAVFVAPTQKYAIAVPRDAGPWHVVDLAQNRTVRTFEGVTGPGDLVEFNSSATAVSLYSPDTRQVTVISGLPAGVLERRTLSVPQVFGSVTALAVNDVGGTVLLGMSDGAAGAILAASDGDFSVIATAARPSAIRFFEGNNDAVFIDRSNNMLIMLRHSEKEWQATPIAGINDGISDPVAIAVAKDPDRVIVANAGTQKITVHNFATGAIASATCESVPESIVSLPLTGTFMVTSHKAVGLIEQTEGKYSVSALPIQ